MSDVRALMTVTGISQAGMKWQRQDEGEPPVYGVGGQVTLEAVYDQDDVVNATWAAATPFAKMEMTIDNPEAFAKLKPGHKYYVDLTLAD